MADSMSPDDRELAESINDFEAAMSARRPDLKPPALDTILAAIDGSNQDRMTLALAREIARRSSAEVWIAYPYPGPDDARRGAYLAHLVEEVTTTGVRAQAVLRSADTAPPYRQIMALSETFHADLLIVPAPFFDAFSELGSDSIGVNLDKLMTQPLPLMIVREPRDDPVQSLRPVLLPLTLHVEENPLAAAWALRLIEEGGTIRVVAVVEDEVLEAAAQLIGEHQAADLDLERLAGLARPQTAGLIAELQRQAQARSLDCRVSVQKGDLVDRVSELAEEGQRLIVTGCDTDPASRSYRNVQAIIRRARDPVLVV